MIHVFVHVIVTSSLVFERFDLSKFFVPIDCRDHKVLKIPKGGEDEEPGR